MKHNKMFVENCWYPAAWEYEISAADNKLARTICEQPIVFFKTESGEYCALEDRCCHRAAPLSMGKIEGDCIRCMYHGILYNTQGECVEIPGQDTISNKFGVRHFPVCEKGHLLWVWMGNPAQAHTDDIIDYPPLSDPQNWRGFATPCYLHYDANWLLIVDNLSDFSHIAFVHTHTLGGSESYAYESVPEELEKLPNGFRLERWHYDSLPPPFHAKVLPAKERTKNVDRCNRVEMYLPGVFLMDTIFTSPSKSKSKGKQDCRQYRNCQYMTPETRHTTHFFWNYLHDQDLNNPAISESLYESLMAGFMEDKVIIEAQQKILQADSSFDPCFILADKALSHFRRLWNDRLRNEAAQYIPAQVTESKNRIL